MAKTRGDFSLNSRPAQVKQTPVRTRTATPTPARQTKQKGRFDTEQPAAPAASQSWWDQAIEKVKNVVSPQRGPAYGGVYNPTITNPNAPAVMQTQRNAIVKAFSARAPAYGGTYNPTITNPLAPQQMLDQRGAILNAFGINTKKGQLRGTSARMNAMAPLNVKQGKVDVPLYGLYPEQAPTTSGGFGSGYGGYGRGGGGRGYGGGGGYDYTPAQYERWLKELLARWNI